MALTGSFLITGAASGIGAAIAKQIAGPNCRLILHTKSNLSGLEAIADLCSAKNATVFTVQGNLTERADTQKVIDYTLELAPALDGIVAAAGYPDWGDFDSLSVDDLMQSVYLMQQSTFMLLQQCKPALQSTQGSFIGISSFLAHKMKVGNNITPASASAKAGLEALIKSYAVQHAAAGIRCNAIVPGYIKKDGDSHRPLSTDALAQINARIPIGRLGLPEEVAALAQFLLSSQSRYITGQLLHIDGGLLLT
ncbi:MAG: SDR family oxidoreductase [Oceanospirillaceae bacterium]|nr:SDR family oxidoreductase [Oceanospirillaceae bacterium]